MIKCFLWLVPCFFVLAGFAQKANYKEAERFMRGNAERLVGSTKVSPHFLKESDKFWYSYKTGDGTRYYFVDPKAKVHRELFDREFMTAEISKYTHGPVNYKELPVRALTFKEDEKTLKFEVDTFRFEYNIYTNRLVKIDSARKKPSTTPRKSNGLVGTYSPDSTYIVYAKSHNLYMLSVKDSVETQITTDGELKYSYAYGDTDTTSKRVSARVTWFENSERFYVRRSDRRKIKTLYVVNNLSSRPTLNEYEYVMAGDQEVQHEELFLVDTADKKLIKVPVEKWPDQTLRLFTPGKRSTVFISCVKENL
ncbi:MAG: DPP IV N-terminal domain-containing protein [Butyricimonas faecalis]